MKADLERVLDCLGLERIVGILLLRQLMANFNLERSSGLILNLNFFGLMATIYHMFHKRNHTG